MTSFSAPIANFVFSGALLEVTWSKRISTYEECLLSTVSLVLRIFSLWLHSASAASLVCSVLFSSPLYEPNWFGFFPVCYLFNWFDDPGATCFLICSWFSSPFSLRIA